MINQEIAKLMTRFVEYAGCSDFAKPKRQLELLTTFLWVRNFAPELTFEAFLTRFALVADYNKTNLKHPDDAIKKLLPLKTEEGSSGFAAFSLQDQIELSAAYIQLYSEYQASGQPLKLSFARFIYMPAVKQQLRAGDFALTLTVATATKKKKSESIPQHVGERCLLTEESQVQHRGTLLAADPQHNSAVFQADSGETVTDVLLTSLKRSMDPPPRPIMDEDDQALPVRAKKTKYVEKAEYLQIEQQRLAGLLLGVVPAGSPAYTYSEDFGDYTAIVDVINSSPLYVDARLVQTADKRITVCDIHPRDRLLGRYEFEANGAVFVLNLICPSAGAAEPLTNFVPQQPYGSAESQ